MRLNRGYFLYLVLCILTGLAAAEVLVRQRYETSYLAANIHKDRVFHHRVLPYTEGTMSSEGDFNIPYRTNNRGMRGPQDYEYAKPDGVYRIAVMGDSFTFGVGVEVGQEYSSLLQKKLDEATPGKYEVLNFGVSSYSPVAELVYFKKEVLKYKPDLMVLALDLGDVMDDYFYEKNLVYDKNGEIAGCDPFMKNGRPDIWAIAKQNSMILTMLDEKGFQSIRKMKAIGLGRYLENKREHVRNKSFLFMEPDLDNVEFDRFIFSREGKDLAIVRRHWQRTAKYLAMIKKMADANGVDFLLTSYPCGQDVGESQWAKGREYWGFEAGRVYDPSFAFSLLKSFARENNIDFVSLLQPMRRNKDKTLYYNNDGHFTPEGQKIVAETLFGSGAFRKKTGL